MESLTLLSWASNFNKMLSSLFLLDLWYSTLDTTLLKITLRNLKEENTSLLELSVPLKFWFLGIWSTLLPYAEKDVVEVLSSLLLRSLMEFKVLTLVWLLREITVYLCKRLLRTSSLICRKTDTELERWLCALKINFPEWRAFAIKKL